MNRGEIVLSVPDTDGASYLFTQAFTLTNSGYEYSEGGSSGQGTIRYEGEGYADIEGQLINRGEINSYGYSDRRLNFRNGEIELAGGYVNGELQVRDSIVRTTGGSGGLTLRIHLRESLHKCPPFSGFQRGDCLSDFIYRLHIPFPLNAILTYQIA